jgi:hypothetical protein
MAQMCPDEGLDTILGQWPKNDTRQVTSNLGLFKSQTATTVITHAQTVANITATTYTSYASQSLATATWGALAERAANTGRSTIYPQVTFPTVGATGDTINGAYLMNDASTKAVGQANFDDGLADVVATNDVVKVTPTMSLLH